MAVPISVLGDPTAPLTYKVPGSTAFIARAASASFDGSGAGGSFLPTMTWKAQNGDVIGHYTAPEVAAGSSADVSWFPSGRKLKTPAGPVLDYNLGEIGNRILTNSDTTLFAPVEYQNVNAGEGILVLGAAPSVSAALATPAHPVNAVDTAGNTYTALGSFAFEANPPNVNEGIYATLYWCPASLTDMVVGVDRVFVNWSNVVFDRIVSVWSVRHSGGAHTPTILAATADHDAAAYAATDVANRTQLHPGSGQGA